MTTRNQVMDAFKTQLEKLLVGGSNDAGVVSVSRKFKSWDQLSDDQCPAMFIVGRQNDYVRNSQAVPALVTLTANLFIYTRELSQDDDVLPSTVLNNLLDALDALFVQTPTSPQPAASNLGGLVSHCRIEGTVLYDAGDLDGIGVAVVPFKILVPAFSY